MACKGAIGGWWRLCKDDSGAGYIARLPFLLGFVVLAIKHNELLQEP